MTITMTATRPYSATETSGPLPARPHVVIVGGGFGGLYLAKALKRVKCDVTIIDRRNFHLFQPLLYQVATGGLAPGDIASPLRAIVRRQRNTRVLLGEVTTVDREKRSVSLADGEEITYDFLVIATGASHDYFGNPDWESLAPGLKTVEDALTIRSRFYRAFEKAEREANSVRRRQLMTFVVVGGGPTGVELAGAISEIAFNTLLQDFRTINPTEARIVLVDSGPQVLAAFPESLGAAAKRALERMHVDVLTGSLATDISSDGVTVRHRDGSTEQIATETVLWAAGVKASPLGALLVDGRDDLLDASGRVRVAANCALPHDERVFVIGDLASYEHQGSEPLPGVAPVAMSQAAYVAKVIRHRMADKPDPAYRYFNKGALATIGRSRAVADFGWLRLTGFPAWFIWVFVHLMSLVGFQNRLVVFVQWVWGYITQDRGNRLITQRDGTDHDLRVPA